ncbi:MAG: class I adenylate-forming enzyme family protein, partial [Coprobacillus sp.]
MIIGENSWHSGITEDMGMYEIDYRHFYTYKNMPHNLYESLSQSVKENPSQIAFVDNDKEEYTYLEFQELVDKMAGVLKYKYHIVRGQHIGLLLYTDIDFCICFYAIAKLGAVCVPLPTKYRQQEIAALVDKAYLDLLIYNEDFKSWIRKEKYQTIELSHCFQKYALEKYLGTHALMTTNDGQLEDEVILMFTS